MATKAVEEWFVDTNILVYATDPLSPWHPKATGALAQAREDGTELVVSSQVLREYLAIVTRSLDGKPPQTANALENVKVFQREMRVLEDSPAIRSRLLDLVEEYTVAGKQIHDANLVSTMLIYGIGHILTNNVGDFVRFSNLITVIPLASFPEQEPAASSPGV